MQERKAQRSVPAHRKARNSSRCACGLNTIAGFDCGHELAQKKIFVSLFAVVRIDVEARTRRWRHDQEFAQLMLLPQIFDEVPPARMQKHLLAIAKPVKKIKHRITPRLLRVVARRQQSAVGDAAREHLALYALAFRAPGCSSLRRLDGE